MIKKSLWVSGVCWLAIMACQGFVSAVPTPTLPAPPTSLSTPTEAFIAPTEGFITPTAAYPTPTAPAECTQWDAMGYPDFVASLKCAVRSGGGVAMLAFYYDVVYFQDCHGDSCNPVSELKEFGDVSSMQQKIKGFLETEPSSGFRFEEREKDVSTFFYPPVYADHTLCAYPSVITWYLCLGFDHMPGSVRSRYAVTDVMLQSP